MINHEPLAEQLDGYIAAVVITLEESNAITISPESVALVVDAKIDPGGKSPPLKTYASTMRIRECTRAYLRRRHDPKTKMEASINGTADLFADQLQPYYPVEREGTKLYALLETLTDEEIERNAARMEKAGKALVRHAGALRAWGKTRNIKTA